MCHVPWMKKIAANWNVDESTPFLRSGDLLQNAS